MPLSSADCSFMPRECSANESRSERPAGEVDRVALTWPDVTNGLFASDGDGRILSILVQHVDGPCDGGWQLVVHGNQ